MMEYLGKKQQCVAVIKEGACHDTGGNGKSENSRSQVEVLGRKSEEKLLTNTMLPM